MLSVGLGSIVSIVTGGSKGIGKATVEEVLNKGSAVYFISRNRSESSQLEQMLSSGEKKIRPIS